MSVPPTRCRRLESPILHPSSGLNRSSQTALEGNHMESKTTQFDVSETSGVALPTTFVAAEESASLTKMLELELEQAGQVAGGMTSVRCCACHCCSVH